MLGTPLLALFALAAAAAPGAPVTPAAGDAAVEIRALTREFVAGFNAGDVDRIMRFYADTYVDLNARQQVQSRAEHAAYYAGILARHDSEVEVSPEEIVVDGHHAVVRGTLWIFRLDAQRHRGEGVPYRYMELWEKQPAGWKAIWGIDGEIEPGPR